MYWAVAGPDRDRLGLAGVPSRISLPFVPVQTCETGLLSVHWNPCPSHEHTSSFQILNRKARPEKRSVIRISIYKDRPFQRAHTHTQKRTRCNWSYFAKSAKVHPPWTNCRWAAKDNGRLLPPSISFLELNSHQRRLRLFSATTW